MATFALKLPLSEGHEAAPGARRGFWRRILNAMIEARLRQAEAEVNRYKHLIPTDPIKDAGYDRGPGNLGALPFVR